MQNPVYQDQQENSKMEKIQKTGFFKESALGFCPPRSKNKKNPPTPSIDLKRKQEEKKPAFRDSF